MLLIKSLLACFFDLITLILSIFDGLRCPFDIIVEYYGPTIRFKFVLSG